MMQRSLFRHLGWMTAVFFFAVLSTPACSQSPAYSSSSQEASILFETPTSDLQALIEQYPVAQPFLPFIKYDVRAHRITYTTTYRGEPATASGVILIPQGRSEPAPLLIWNHGTTFNKLDVASEWTNGEHIELVPATAGFITFLPDYVGYGASKHLLHPYMIQEPLVVSIIDMIGAGKEYLRAQNVAFDDRLYLWGFSEGGYATLAVQKEIESNPAHGLAITASYPVAGPYDLKETLDIIFSKDRYVGAGYLAYVFAAYNDTFWMRPYTDFFQEPIATKVEQLAAGQFPLHEIGDVLTASLAGFMNPTFLEHYRSGGEEQVQAAFSANSDFDWTPQSPTYLYHGTADADVPFEIGQAIYESFIARGADPETVHFIPVEGMDHNASGVAALLAFLQKEER